MTQSSAISSINLEHRHPDLLRISQQRKMHSDLYNGSWHIKENSGYLIQHPLETDKQFNIRVLRSAYRNFAAPIVDVFSSSINQGRPRRTLPPSLDSLLTDCDRAFNSADVFFENVTRLSAAIGTHFVLVDMEQQAGETRLEDQNSGRRQVPYFVSVNAEDVLDWNVGRDGALEWVTIRGRSYHASQPFKDGQEVRTVTVWTRNEWMRYEDSKGFSALVGSGVNPLGRVPLVPFLFEPIQPMVGLSCLDDVAGLILRIYNKDSELDKMLFDCAVPILIGQNIKQDEIEGFFRSSSNMLCTSDGTLMYVEPSGNSFSAISDYINRDIASVREIAMRMVRTPSMSVESADGKRLDKQQLDSQLARFARICQSAEERCWKLAARWIGAEDVRIDAPYNEDFDVGDVSAAITDRLVQLHAANIVSRETVLQSRDVRRLLPKDFDSRKNSQELSAESARENQKGAGGGISRHD